METHFGGIAAAHISSQQQACRLSSEAEASAVRPQIAKLLIVPCVCLVERFWLGKQFSKQVLLSVCTVIVGVAVV